MFLVYFAIGVYSYKCKVEGAVISVLRLDMAKVCQFHLVVFCGVLGFR